MASGSASTAVAQVKSADDLLAEYRAESMPAPNAPFVWKPSSPGNADGLSDFLEAHLPSTTTSRGGSRHIWVTIPYKRQSPSRSDNDMKLALAQAHHAFAELSTSCRAIEDNDKIPQRQNRKQGMSKGQRKKVLIDDFGASLPRWADKGGLLTGKWLMFKDDKWVDYGFRTLAYSIIDGPLSQCKSANVHTVKVDCADHRKNGEQLISLFYEDVWDETASTEIARIMLRHHCQYSRAAKTDLHSALGINSKHWTNLPSSIHRFDSLIPRETQEELKEQYRLEKAQRDKEKKRRGEKSSRSPEASRSAGGKKVTAKGAPMQAADFWQEGDDDRDEGEGMMENDLGSRPQSAKPTTLASSAPATDQPEAAVRSEPITPAASTSAVAGEDDDSETEDEEEEMIKSAPRRAEKYHMPVSSTFIAVPASTAATASTSTTAVASRAHPVPPPNMVPAKRSSTGAAMSTTAVGSSVAAVSASSSAPIPAPFRPTSAADMAKAKQARRGGKGAF